MSEHGASPLVSFLPNRVWRCYTGGLLLDRFLDPDGRGPEPADGHFPEEWIASTTIAMNGPRRQRPDEGFSRVRLLDGTAGVLFRDALAADPEGMLGPRADPTAGTGVLCKLLDSAVRLPIQCHPDRPFARRHYGSPFGKEESWFVLGTREVDGQSPYLLIGFRPGVTRDRFAAAVDAQDVAAMAGMLHRFPVEPGDCFYIPGGVPHAIGPGVFLLEVQEPTDWVVQPERFIADTELTHEDMWGPLTHEVGLDCFDYAGAADVAAIERRVRLEPSTVRLFPRGVFEALAGPPVTSCFCVSRLTFEGHVTLDRDAPWEIAVVTEGHGRYETESGTGSFRRGSSLFIPHRVRRVTWTAEEKTTIHLVTSGPVPAF